MGKILLLSLCCLPFALGAIYPPGQILACRDTSRYGSLCYKLPKEAVCSSDNDCDAGFKCCPFVAPGCKRSACIKGILVPAPIPKPLPLPKPIPRPYPKPLPAAYPKPLPRPYPKPQPIPYPKPLPGAYPKPQQRPYPKSQTAVYPKPPPRPYPKPLPKPAPKPKPEGPVYPPKCSLPPSKGHACRRRRSYAKGGKAPPKAPAKSYAKGGKAPPKAPAKSYAKGGKAPSKAPVKSYSHDRYYYDPKTDSCIKFYYAGCGGNKNNYKSAFDCSLHCRSYGF